MTLSKVCWLILAAAASLVGAQDCNPDLSAEEILVDETVAPGDVVWSSANLARTYAGVNTSYLDLMQPYDTFGEGGTEVGLRAVGVWTDLVDCVTDVATSITSPDGTTTVYSGGVVFFYCNNGGEVNIQSDVVVATDNNRSPEFSQTDYVFSDIDKVFPTDVALSLVYEDDFLLVQDIDHTGQDATDQLFIEIQSQDSDLVALQFSETTDTNDVCTAIGDKALEATKVDVVFVRNPGDVVDGDEYVFTVFVNDTVGASATATVTLQFAQSDARAPEFESAYYSSSIEDPTISVFPQSQVLPVQPADIRAVDPDADANVVIAYSLESAQTPDCSGSFAIETQGGGLGGGDDYGELQWVSELSRECQALDAIFLVVVATQTGQDVEAKETRIPLAVLMPGDVLNPVFGEESYQGTIADDSTVTLSNGPIVATGGDSYLDSTVTLDIDPESESATDFEVTPAGEIVFNGNVVDLPAGDVITILARATQDDDANRVTVVPVILTYPSEDSQPPVFDPVLFEMVLEDDFADTPDCLTLTADRAVTFENVAWEPVEYEDYFVLDPVTGTYSCLQLPDELKPPPARISMSAVATDQTSGKTDETAVIVTFLPGPPSFDEPVFTTDLDADYPDTPACLTVTATGNDVIAFAQDTVVPPEYEPFFVLDSNTGVYECLELDDTVPETQYVQITISASNDDGSDESLVVFELLDEAVVPVDPPTFDQSIYDDAELQLPYEDDTACYTVTATGDPGIGYVILQVSPTEYTPYFDIRNDSDTGIFTCLEIPATGLPMTDKVTVSVQASNDGGSDDAAVVFTLLEGPVVEIDPPTFDESIYDDVELQLPYEDDTDCYTVAAAGDPVIGYAILQVSPTEYAPYFDLRNDSDTGIFTCLELPATGLPTTDKVTVSVQASNDGGSDNAAVVFTLLEEPDVEIVPPEFAESIYDDKMLQLPYETDADCYAVTADGDPVITYTVLQVSPADYEDYFTIRNESNSGVFTCLELPTVGLPSTDAVTVSVQASNDGGNDEAAVVFNLLEPTTTSTDPGISTDSTTSSSTSVSAGTGSSSSSISTSTEPTTNPVDPPEFQEAIYDDPEELDEGYATDTNCYTVTAISDTPVTYSVEQVSPADYAPFFSIRTDGDDGVITCEELDNGLTSTDRVTLVVAATNDGGTDEATVVFTLLEDQGGNGNVRITSGDFGGTQQQTVGYPQFIYLESFISMPLAQVTVSVSLDEVAFSATGSDLYVDDLGYVYAYQTSGAEDISGVCGDACQVTVTASGGATNSEDISVTVVPLPEEQITALTIPDDMEPEDALDDLNDVDEDNVWFRQVQYLPSSSSTTLARQSENTSPILYVTAMNATGNTFLTNGEVETLLAGSEDFVVTDLIVTNNKDDGNGGTGDGGTGGGGGGGDDDDTGLIIGISILAVLLALSIAGSIGYFFWDRKKRQQTLYKTVRRDTNAAPNGDKNDFSLAETFNSPVASQQQQEAVTPAAAVIAGALHEDSRSDGDDEGPPPRTATPPPSPREAPVVAEEVREKAVAAARAGTEAAAVAADRPPPAREPTEFELMMRALSSDLSKSSTSNARKNSPPPQTQSILKVNTDVADGAASDTTAPSSASAGVTKPITLDRKISFDARAEVIEVPKEEVDKRLKGLEEESETESSANEDSGKEDDEGVARF